MPGVALLSRRRLSGFPVDFAMGLGPGLIAILESLGGECFFGLADFFSEVVHPTLVGLRVELNYIVLRSATQYNLLNQPTSNNESFESL